MKIYHIQRNETGAQAFVNGMINKGASMSYAPLSEKAQLKLISLVNQLFNDKQ